MNKKAYYPMLVAVAILALAALGCGPVATVVVTATPPPQIAANPTPTPLPAAADDPAATDTPAPDVAGSGGCTLNAGWVADVTVPDNTQFASGAAFVKTWRVRNSGTCAWEAGSQLVYVSGDPLGGPGAVSVPAVAAGATADVSVNFTAPATPGTYRFTWQMQSAADTRFGSQVYAQIVVPAAAAPTAAPATAAPNPPDLVITDLAVDTADPLQGTPLHVVATIRNQGGSAATFHWAWWLCATCEYVEAPTALTLAAGAETAAQLEYTFDSYSTYTTDAVADSRGEITEGDEDDNGRQLVISVGAGPTAEPTMLTLPATTHSGEATTVGRGPSRRVGVTLVGGSARADVLQRLYGQRAQRRPSAAHPGVCAGRTQARSTPGRHQSRGRQPIHRLSEHPPNSFNCTTPHHEGKQWRGTRGA